MKNSYIISILFIVFANICIGMDKYQDINSDKQSKVEEAVSDSDKLFKVVRKNNDYKLKKLLNSNPSLIKETNEDGDSVFVKACDHKAWEVIEYLLNDFQPKGRGFRNRLTKNDLEKGIKRIDSNASIKKGELETSDLVEQIMELIDKHIKKRDLLFETLYGNNLDKFKKLLDKNPELIKQTDNFGDSAFIISCNHKNEEIINYLLSKYKDELTKDDLKKGLSIIDKSKEDFEQHQKITLLIKKRINKLQIKYNISKFSELKNLTNSELNNLPSLDLACKNIGDAGIKILANSKNLNKLTSLNLSNNEIGVEGAQALATSSYLTNLTSLDLRNNMIGAAGAEALANSKNLKNLTSLNLSYNLIKTTGAKALANSENLKNSTILDLSHNQIGDKGAESLAQSSYLKNLKELNLSGNQIGDDAGVQKLAKSPYLRQLKELNLSGNQITDEGVQALVDSAPYFRYLKELDLSGNQITDEGVKEALANNTTYRRHGGSLTYLLNNLESIPSEPYYNYLEKLDLSHNRIGDKGVQALAKSSYLRPLITK